jgi:hypothetical protein
MKITPSSIIFFAMLVCRCKAAAPVTYFEVDEVRPSVVQHLSNFGQAVDISGGFAISGAPLEGPSFGRQGAAYLFAPAAGTNDWNQVARITPTVPAGSDSLEGDQFGITVALDGETAVIGSNSRSSHGLDSGEAYVFRRTGGIWNQVAILSPSDTGPDQFFGQSVAIQGSTIVVGANASDAKGLDSGAAYLFEESTTTPGTWAQVAKLIASDGAAGDGFGISVAINSSRAIIGSYQSDGAATDTGAAYIFERNALGAWNEVAKLTAADPNQSDEFGTAVDISGGSAIIGAWMDDEAGTNQGAAYLFQRDAGGQWSQTAKLMDNSRLTDERFGSTVSIHGDRAAAGALGDRFSVRTYSKDAAGSWNLGTLVGDAVSAGRLMGSYVALDEGELFVGAYRRQYDGVTGGAAYVFVEVPEPSTGVLACVVVVAFARGRRAGSRIRRQSCFR